MNVKQGELVRYAGNQLKDAYGWVGITVQRKDHEGGPAWIIEPPLSKGNWVFDRALRPIRDNPGTDETLLWAPVPSNLKEKA